MTTDIHAVPKHLPPLPEGEVYLGQGPLNLPDGMTPFRGHATNVDHCKKWSCNIPYVGYTSDHYTAPLDSPVTRHILAHRVPDGVPVLPEGWVYAGTLGDYEGRCSGLALHDGKEWSKSRGWLGMARRPDGISYGWHFAVKIDSPIARKLLGLEPDTRPSWEDAPDDATHLAQEDDGDWVWFLNCERDPTPAVGSGWDFYHCGKRADCALVKTDCGPNPDWRETLEPRPAQEGTTREVSKLTLKIDASEVERAIKQALDKIEVWADECRLGYVAPDTHEELLGLFPDFKGHPEGWTTLTDEQISGLQSGWDEAPDLVIPKDAAEVPGAIGYIGALSETGYRLEFDSEGIRGWKE